MTDLRALLKAATKRPWHVIMPGDSGWIDRRKYRCVAFGPKSTPYATSPLDPADAHLIVAVVNALPVLLGVVDAAKELIDTGCWGHADHAGHRCGAGRLREALERLETA